MTGELEDWGTIASRFMDDDPIAVAKVIRLVSGHLVHLGAYDLGDARADLIQDVLAAISSNLRRQNLRESTAFVSFVGTITRNKWFDFRRGRAANHVPASDGYLESVADPRGDDGSPSRIDASRALAALPELEKAVVQAVYLRDLSFDETAKETGVPRGSIGRVLERGLQLMRQRLLGKTDAVDPREASGRPFQGRASS